MIFGSRIASIAGAAPAPVPVPTYWGLHIVAQEANTVVGMEEVGELDPVELKYSVNDGEDWSDFTPGTTTVRLARAGDFVCFCAGSSGNAAISKDTTNYRKFTLSKRCAAHGSLMSLLDGTSETTARDAALGNGAFCKLFLGCTTLTSAPELPSRTLSQYCYCQLFNGCTALLTAPTELPAATLAPYCYSSMFNGCSALAAAPTIDGTVLASYCCEHMFAGCTSLAAMPALLASGRYAAANSGVMYAYDNMFNGCTSLTSANDVMLVVCSTCTCRSMFYGCTSIREATVRIVNVSESTGGLSYMFYGCSDLSAITMHWTRWQDTIYGTSNYDWVAGVAENGVFKCCKALGTEETIARGNSRCPSSWTVESIVNEPVKFTAEEANSTISMTKQGSPPNVTLQTSIDNGESWQEFIVGTTTIVLSSVGDEVLFKAGETENTAFASNDGSSRNVFVMTGKIAASGNIMSLLSEDAVTLTSNCAFRSLFNGCTALTTPPDLPALCLSENCYWSMFNGCTSLRAAPELPATGLMSVCYSYMFYNCSSMVTSPVLKNGGTIGICYNHMFDGCSSLTSAECWIDSSIAPNSQYIMTGMFNGCSSLQTVKFPNLKSFQAPGGMQLTTDWMAGVPATGIFKCPIALGTDATIQRGASYCPSGWTVVNV